MERKTITLPLGWEFTIIVGCHMDKKPKNIPLIQVEGSAIQLKRDPIQKSIPPVDYKNTSFNVVSLLQRMSITSINAVKKADFCLIYINGIVCLPNDKSAGFGSWDYRYIPYQELLKKLLRDTYKVTSFRQKSFGKCELRPEKRSRKCDIEIVFSTHN